MEQQQFVTLTSGLSAGMQEFVAKVKVPAAVAAAFSEGEAAVTAAHKAGLTLNKAANVALDWLRAQAPADTAARAAWLSKDGKGRALACLIVDRIWSAGAAKAAGVRGLSASSRSGYMYRLIRCIEWGQQFDVGSYPVNPDAAKVAAKAGRKAARVAAKATASTVATGKATASTVDTASRASPVATVTADRAVPYLMAAVSLVRGFAPADPVLAAIVAAIDRAKAEAEAKAKASAAKAKATKAKATKAEAARLAAVAEAAEAEAEAAVKALEAATKAAIKAAKAVPAVIGAGAAGLAARRTATAAKAEAARRAAVAEAGRAKEAAKAARLAAVAAAGRVLAEADDAEADDAEADDAEAIRVALM